MKKEYANMLHARLRLESIRHDDILENLDRVERLTDQAWNKNVKIQHVTEKTTKSPVASLAGAKNKMAERWTTVCEDAPFSWERQCKSGKGHKGGRRIRIVFQKLAKKQEHTGKDLGRCVYKGCLGEHWPYCT